jgi:hypothetical protein
MYTIEFDEAVGLLEARLTGFWTTDIVHAFHRDYIAMIDRYSGRFPDFPTVSDSRGFAVMSPETSQVFTDGARETALRHKGRLAVVFQSRIAKLQAERVAQKISVECGADREQRFFTDAAEARRWALEGDACQ